MTWTREPEHCTCGTCGHTWDYRENPTPAHRCPKEAEHQGTMTWTPLPEKLDALERRIIAAFPESFYITEDSFAVVSTGIERDILRIVDAARMQDQSLYGVGLAGAMANVAEELLGRIERDAAEIAEMDSWLDSMYGDAQDAS